MHTLSLFLIRKITVNYKAKNYFLADTNRSPIQNERLDSASSFYFRFVTKVVILQELVKITPALLHSVHCSPGRIAYPILGKDLPTSTPGNHSLPVSEQQKAKIKFSEVP